MRRQAFEFEGLENAIARDPNFFSTLISFVAVLVVFLNQVFVSSIVVGAIASGFFFSINAVFLGHAFFEDEISLVRVFFGGLVLFVFLGVMAWLAIIVYSLDVRTSSLVLVVIGGLASLLNRMRRKVSR